MATDEHDFYAVLGVSRNASDDELRRAYKVQALKYHPDKNPKGTERFKLVSEAFAVLSDPAARSEYDYNASNARFRAPAGPERYQDFPAGPMGGAAAGAGPSFPAPHAWASGPSLFSHMAQTDMFFSNFFGSLGLSNPFQGSLFNHGSGLFGAFNHAQARQGFGHNGMGGGAGLGTIFGEHGGVGNHSSMGGVYGMGGYGGATGQQYTSSNRGACASPSPMATGATAHTSTAAGVSPPSHTRQPTRGVGADTAAGTAGQGRAGRGGGGGGGGGGMAASLGTSGTPIHVHRVPSRQTWMAPRRTREEADRQGGVAYPNAECTIPTQTAAAQAAAAMEAHAGGDHQRPSEGIGFVSGGVMAGGGWQARQRHAHSAEPLPRPPHSTHSTGLGDDHPAAAPAPVPASPSAAAAGIPRRAAAMDACMHAEPEAGPRNPRGMATDTAMPFAQLAKPAQQGTCPRPSADGGVGAGPLAGAAADAWDALQGQSPEQQIQQQAESQLHAQIQSQGHSPRGPMTSHFHMTGRETSPTVRGAPCGSTVKCPTSGSTRTGSGALAAGQQAAGRHDRIGNNTSSSNSIGGNGGIGGGGFGHKYRDDQGGGYAEVFEGAGPGFPHAFSRPTSSGLHSTEPEDQYCELVDEQAATHGSGQAPAAAADGTDAGNGTGGGGRSCNTMHAEELQDSGYGPSLSGSKHSRASSAQAAAEDEAGTAKAQHTQYEQGPMGQFNPAWTSPVDAMQGSYASLGHAPPSDTAGMAQPMDLDGVCGIWYNPLHAPSGPGTISVAGVVGHGAGVGTGSAGFTGMGVEALTQVSAAGVGTFRSPAAPSTPTAQNLGPRSSLVDTTIIGSDVISRQPAAGITGAAGVPHAAAASLAGSRAGMEGPTDVASILHGHGAALAMHGPFGVMGAQATARDMQGAAAAGASATEADLALTLEEMFSGGTKRVRVRRTSHLQGTDSRVSGAPGETDGTVGGGAGGVYDNINGGGGASYEQVLEVAITPGLRNGTHITYAGLGDPGRHAQRDLILIVRELPHARYVRRGDNLITRATVPLATALSGGRVHLLGLDGRALPIDLSGRVVHPGLEEILIGEGMPVPERPGERGNLVVQYDVAFPEKLSEVQRKGLRSLLAHPEM